MDNLAITVITVTYNSRHVIEECLNGIGQIKNHLLVVDNSSQDSTVSYLKQMRIRVIELNNNLGFGTAANIGVAKISTPYFCLINPDCRPSLNLLKKGLELLRQNPKSCVVPIKIIEKDKIYNGVQYGYTRVKLLKDMIETNYGYSNAVKWLEKLPSLHDHSWNWPLGVCLFMAKDFFEHIGGFNSSIFMYGEDVDLGRRIADAGGCIVPLDHFLFHDGNNSSLIEHKHKINLLNQGRLQYAQIHYGTIFAIGLAAIARGASYMKIILRAGGLRK